jgi:hypothetical protein
MPFQGYETMNEVATRLDLHPSEVSRLNKSGRLPGATKLPGNSRTWLFPAGVTPLAPSESPNIDKLRQEWREKSRINRQRIKEKKKEKKE